MTKSNILNFDFSNIVKKPEPEQKPGPEPKIRTSEPARHQLDLNQQTNIPPHNIAFEQSILSAILIDPDLCRQAIEALQPEHFYNSAHQKIFAAMFDLFKNDSPIELVTVATWLETHNKDVPASFVSNLLSHPLATDIKFYAEDVINKYLLRRTIEIASRIVAAGYENNSDSASKIEFEKQKLDEISHTGNQRKFDDAILTDVEFSGLDIKQKRHFLSPWLTEQSISLISGWRGTGKTWFGLGILDAITRGRPFGPWSSGVSAPCLYLDAEMPVTDVQERLSELSLEKRTHPLYIYSDAHASHLGLPRANLADETWRKKMKDILISRGVKLWVIDNLASLASGLDENAKKDWDPINQWLLELRFAGIATMAMHHTNKDGGQRGTSAREDNIDCSIILKRPAGYSPEDGCRFITNFTKARVRTADLQLIADTEFSLIQNELGNTEWTYTLSEKNHSNKKKQHIIKLIADGMSYSDIAEIVGIAKSYIAKIKKQGIESGYFNKNGGLSIKGNSFISDAKTE